MRVGLLVVAVLALIGFLIIAVLLPRMEETELKEAAQALIAGADPAKQQVAAAAEKSGKLAGAGTGVKVVSRNDAGHGEMKWIVADNGAIRAWNAQNALEIVLTPSLKSGRVSWNCKGHPVNAMPQSCNGR